MKRFKPATIILLSIVLQFTALYWSESGFRSLSDITLSYMEKSLADDGMPTGQRQDVSAAFREFRFDITHYVNTLGLQLIMLNAATWYCSLSWPRTLDPTAKPDIGMQRSANHRHSYHQRPVAPADAER